MASNLPAPFISGTITFGILTFAAVLMGYVARFTGKLNKENSAIFSLLSGITGFCLWIFWACCWLHQWHLLIYPEYRAPEEN